MLLTDVRDLAIPLIGFAIGIGASVFLISIRRHVMTPRHHPQFSGEKPDATVWYCETCRERYDEASGLTTHCCGRHLTYIDYHRATETELMERVIRGEA